MEALTSGALSASQLHETNVTPGPSRAVTGASVRHGEAAMIGAEKSIIRSNHIESAARCYWRVRRAPGLRRMAYKNETTG